MPENEPVFDTVHFFVLNSKKPTEKFLPIEVFVLYNLCRTKTRRNLKCMKK